MNTSKIKLLAAILAFGFSPLAFSQTTPSPTLGMEILKDLGNVKDMVEVPDGPFHAVENQGGGILFISSSGRFVFGGVAFDIWNKKQLRTVNDMRYAFNHIDFKTLGVNFDEIKAIEFGNGNKEVVIFSDPNCMWCHRLVEETLNDQALTKEYKFKVVAVPALGNDSFIKTKRLYCAKKTKPEVLLDAMMHDKTLSLEQVPNCNTSGLDKRLVISEAVGVKSVPFIVAPDGRFTTGKPRDLKAWLELGEKENERQAQIYRQAIKEAAAKLTKQTGSSIHQSETSEIKK